MSATSEPRRLYDKCIDDVLSHLLATQEEGDPPQLRPEDVQRLPPDITHDLLHRLLSSSALPRRRKPAAAVSPKPTFASWAAPAALEVEERAKRVNDELLALLVSPHLTHLRLRMCVRVTDLSFQRLFAPEAGQESFALREVKLDTCWGLTDSALHILAKGCPSLTRLELIGSSRFTCNALDWPHLTSLQVLLIKACSGISESAFSDLADRPSTSLRVLGLHFQSGDKPANAFLAQLAQMCPNLEELQLVRSFDPPAQGVAPLQPGQFGRLRALSLGDESLSFRAASVSERYLEALLDALPQLEALHCSQIYDVARLTNDQAARRLKVLITATTENRQVPLLTAALKRTAATLQVLSVPTAIREAPWGASEVGFVSLSNEDRSELFAVLARGLPSLRFLRFPTGRLSDLTQFLTDVQTSSGTSQMELHTLQIASLESVREMTVEAVDETIFRRLPSSVRVVDLKCYFGMPHLDSVYNKLRAKYPDLVGPQTPSWSLHSSLLDFGYHIG